MKKMTLLALSFLTLAASTASAMEKNMMVRMRTIVVSPDESGTPSTIGGTVTINNESVPELDITYFFTKNIAAELILATATHDVSLYGSSLQTQAAVSLGSVSLLPPTLLVQYHAEVGKFKPYVGAGINYTFFYDANYGDVKHVKYDNSIGYAAQVGVDYDMGNNFYLNADVKKVKLSTDVEANYQGTIVKAEVELNPTIVGLGIGYRF